MSLDKVTQGKHKWELEQFLSGSENHKGWILFGYFGSKKRRWIADISPMNDENGDPSPEGIQTAHLLRSAKELYEALEECAKDSFTAADGMTQSGRCSPAGLRYSKAEAALAAARGEL